MKKTMVLLLILGLSAVFIACSRADDTDVLKEYGLPVTVTGSQERSITDTFRSPGVVEPVASYDVFPISAGVVKELLVKPGDRVVKGEILYMLDSATAENNLKLKESSLRTVKNSLTNQLSDTKEQREKVKLLYDQGAASKSELDALDSQIRDIGVQLDDAVTAYLNQVDTLKETLDERIVISPSSGVVSEITFNAGESINLQDRINVVDDSEYIVASYLTADQLRMLDGIEAIAVWLDGKKEHAVDAQVKTTDRVKDPQTNMYRIELSIVGTAYEIYDGEYAEVVFDTSTRIADVLPLKSVKRVGEDTYIYYIENKVANRVDITLGKVVDEFVEVIGLPTGRMWVVKGSDRVQDGSSVEVVE